MATSPQPDLAAPAVVVRDVGKRYRIYGQPQDRLKQMLLSRVGRTYGEDFWALRHVSFDVGRGERFGLIGRNGSGKSTLLQMIAGTLDPTEGDVRVEGRVAALLELGSGFNPEFTGRENVFINAAIHGMSRSDVEHRFDDIAAFADIGAFLDQPVKLYSSGMFVRLAFAVGTSIDADVLLIDEALAVGDVFFRQKCYRRLETLRERGVSILLVSHGMGDIEEFCDRALLLDRGKAMFIGPSVEAVKRYYLVENLDRLGPLQLATDAPASASANADDADWPAAAMRAVPLAAQVEDGWARCLQVGITDESGAPCVVFAQGQRAVFWFEFELLRAVDVPVAGVVIHSDKGTIVHGKSTLEANAEVPVGTPPGTRLRLRQDVSLEIAVGEYTFEVALSMIAREVYDRRDRLGHGEIASNVFRLCAVPTAGQFAVVFRRAGQGVQLLHHGIANLPGALRLTAQTVEPRA